MSRIPGENWYPKYRPTGSRRQRSKAISFVASERHFLDHLAPVFLALPKEKRGQFYVPHGLRSRADALGIQSIKGNHAPGDGPVCVAAYNDLKRHAPEDRPLILFEHGSGQSYSNKHTSYAGGVGYRKLVGLFVCPNNQAARRNKKQFPGCATAVVGSPKLDQYVNAPAREPNSPPVIAISFHWESIVCPETRSSYKHYMDALPELAEVFGDRLLGHAHPRFASTIGPVYEKLGIEFVSEFDQVIQRADLYVVDNSSTLFEFAALDRPVVVMNAPWYRRSVNHGLRFWEFADIGLQVDEPADLLPTIQTALERPENVEARRREIIREVYPYLGQAAEKAAEAVLDYLQNAAYETPESKYRKKRTRKVRRQVSSDPQVSSWESFELDSVERAAALPGLMSREELTVLANMAMAARQIGELGVWQGRSLGCMALASPEAILVGVDWFQDMSHLGYKGSSPKKVHASMQKIGISRDRYQLLISRSDEAALNFEGEFDFIHIDAGHSEEELRSDIKLWLPKIMPGGGVSFHDYGRCKNPDVERPAVQEVVDAWRNDHWAEVEHRGRQIAFRHLIAEYGALYIAYGEKAREAVCKSVETLREFVPDMPVAVIASQPLGIDEHFIYHRDVHPGARFQKSRMYALSPFSKTLYMDADTTLLVDPVSYFNFLETHDLVMSHDMVYTVGEIGYSRLIPEEIKITKSDVYNEMLYYNTGVILFRRSARNRALFQAWHDEWRQFAQHDQMALARAMANNPVRIATMRNAWNSHKADEAEFAFHRHHSVRREGAPG